MRATLSFPPEFMLPAHYNSVNVRYRPELPAFLLSVAERYTSWQIVTFK